MGGSVLINTSEENGQQVVPGINLRFNTNNDPGGPDVQHRELPGSVLVGQLTDARALYALLTGQGGRGDRPGGARPRHEQVHRVRHPVARGQDWRVRRVPAGFLEDHAGADRHRGPSLGRPDAVLGHGTARCPPRRWRACAACRGLATAACTASATSWRRVRRAARSRSSSSSRRAPTATTPTGTTWPPRSASPGGRTCRRASCGRCWATPTRRRCAPAGRLPTSARGWGSSPASTGRTRAASSP